MSQASIFGPSWQGSLSDLANIVYQIKRLKVFGRLLLRNSERLSIAHLYFRAGKLVHIAGNRGDARAILNELQEWTQGAIRFDRGITTADVTLNDEYGHILEGVLMNLQRSGVVTVPILPRVIESGMVGPSETLQTLTPREWRILIEATRRVSLAVAYVVGPREAVRVLQNILNECVATFPAFTDLKVAPSGYLAIVEHSSFDRMARADILKGFTTLITICQHCCVPLLGEKEASKLIIQALQDISPALINVGVLRIDDRSFSSNGP